MINTIAETYCPICTKPVTKVKELTVQEIGDAEGMCSSEYWLHRGKQLIKIIDGETPTDAHMKKVLNGEG